MAAVRASPVGVLSLFFVLRSPLSLERSALGRTASATRLRTAIHLVTEKPRSTLRRALLAKAHALKS